jgi:hypothetical protein
VTGSCCTLTRENGKYTTFIIASAVLLALEVPKTKGQAGVSEILTMLYLIALDIVRNYWSIL